MKIALYGDSFAYSKYPLDTSWYSLLGKKLNCTVDTYGIEGSSVYHSYKQFMKSHSGYDLVIFLVTQPTRYYRDVSLSTNETLNFHAIQAIEWCRENNKLLNEDDLEKLDNVEGWYKASDIEYSIDMTELMMDKIKSIRDDVIFVPCFPNSFTEKWKKLEPNTVPLIELFFRQTALLWDQPDVQFDMFTRENPELISAHLGPEFNEYFCSVVCDRIFTGKWDFSDYKNVTLHHTRADFYQEAN